jgi:hypothetical protein
MHILDSHGYYALGTEKHQLLKMIPGLVDFMSPSQPVTYPFHDPQNINLSTWLLNIGSDIPGVDLINNDSSFNIEIELW